MATWKKVIVSGSAAHLLNVTASNLIEDRIVIAGPQGALESTDLIYSGSVFHFGQSTVSGSIFSGSEFSGSFFGDGSGLTGLVATLNVTGSGGSGSVDLKTEALTVEGTPKEVEVAISGSSITIGLPDNVEISGSLIVSGSVTGSNAKFDYIQVSGSVVNDLTASYAMNAETTALNSGNTFQVTPATASWIITHSLNTKYPIVEVWDSATDKIVEPDEITSIDYQTIKIDFTSPIAGWANISRAGHVVSGSVLWENIIAGPSGSQIEISDGTLGITGSVSVTGDVSASAFSGSFFGDGSGLTGVAATLGFSGSIGTGSVDLKTEALVITGSANGIVTEASGSELLIKLDDHVIVNQLTAATASLTGSFTGSFFGDGSGLTGIATVLEISGSNGTGSVDLKTEPLVVLGTTNEVDVIVSASTITVGLTDNVQISGSLIVSGALTGSNAKFDYIEVSGSVINNLTASYAMNAETSAINSGNTFQVTPATASWIITHSLNTKYPLVEIWDSATDRVIEPSQITSIDYQTIKVDFTVPVAGWANISRAGHVVSGSILWENIIAGPSGSQVEISDGTLGITGSLSITGSVVDFTGVDAISGSVFSGSFVGDGSGLTGIAATLLFSGSEGSGQVDLKTEAFNITGSANGIVTSGSGTDLHIRLDDHVIINQLTVATASITGSFTGSFFGDGTGLTGVTAEWDGTHEGDAIISGSLYVTGSVVDFTQVNAISGSIFSGSFVGDGSGLTGIATSLIVSASDGNSDIIDLKTEALSFSGSANEVEIIFHTGSNTIQVGLPDSVIIKDNLTVGGDLIVNGDTTVINTTEVLVEDKFIILASGSTGPTDGGIIVQSSGSAQGYAFGMDASAERWAMQQDLGSPAIAINPDAYVTTTQFGLEANQPQYPAYGATGSAYGNMWVSTDTGDIYIWA